MPIWEYLVVFIQDTDMESTSQEADLYADADIFTDRLNTYGRAGWELVSFEWVEKGAKAAFKRAVNAG
ncbi:MAG: hypothetical protein CL610_22455 [Anaerolineaceae bacterium]|nr:hypothetical protein [Anaerolineaceae bacterium]